MTERATRDDRSTQTAQTRWLLAFGRPVLWPLAISALCRVAELAAGAVLLGYAAQAAVSAVTTRSGSPWLALAVVMALASVRGVFHYLEHYTGHWVAFRVLAMMRVFFYRRLAALAPAVTYRHRTGDLLGRVTRDIDRLEVFFAHTLVPAIGAIVMPTGVLVWFIAIGHSDLAFALLFFFVALGSGIPFVGRARVGRAEATVVGLGGAISAHLADSIAGLREISAHGAESQRMRAIDSVEGELAVRYRTVARWAAARAGLARGFQVGALVVVIVIAHAGGADAPTIAAMLGVTVATFPALAAVDGFAALLGSTRSSLRRVREIADAEPATPDPVPADAWRPDTSAPEICFDGVVFEHRNRIGRRILDGVDLTVPAGGFVGIVGATGSGKSTLGALVARIWDPVAGRVLWDGHDLRRIPVGELRNLVTVVDQEPYLLPGSIAANLRLGAPDATDERLWDALRAVDLDTVVRAMPDGLDTVIADRDVALSGGQRQRLALARAVLHDGSVIVVDEGTGQLDTATESRVIARLRQVWAGRTVLWITHRESTLARCDAVYRVRDGRVIPQESGAGVG
ncbi:amino acid ABC transporter ATP-binding/permease protein [Gordonia aurantiaca]|uniref:amino acid ABC transporter ATP-binding/permease protein n=1 Tax=Gordonia sp. B21 TaxID=3151852 RepID=UPI003265195F